MFVKRFRKFPLIASVVILSLSTVGISGVSVSAETQSSLTLNCNKDDVILPGMEWSLFRVGERSGADFVLTGDFSGYQIDLSDMSVENISAGAKTLEAYTVSDQIPALKTGKTDEKGKLTFPELEKGLYLATGKNLTIGHNTYVPSALLIEVRDNDEDFSYDAYPKFMYTLIGDTVSKYEVKKVWIGDEENMISRPASITADIYKEDELIESVTLSEDNNWEYQWESTDDGAQWYVVEKDVPEGYKVQVENNIYQYLLKNSYILSSDDKPEPTTIAPTDTTKVDETDAEATTTKNKNKPSSTETKTSGNNKTTVKTTTASTKLPQTGQLWWPVPVLGAGGIIFIAVGARIKKKDDE